MSINGQLSFLGSVKDSPDTIIGAVESLKNSVEGLSKDIDHIPTDLKGFASIIRNTIHCLACFSDLDSVCSLNCTVQALYENTLRLVEGTGIALNVVEKACAAIRLPFISSFCSNINSKQCINGLKNVIGDSCRIHM